MPLRSCYRLSEHYRAGDVACHFRTFVAGHHSGLLRQAVIRSNSRVTRVARYRRVRDRHEIFVRAHVVDFRNRKREWQIKFVRLESIPAISLATEREPEVRMLSTLIVVIAVTMIDDGSSSSLKVNFAVFAGRETGINCLDSGYKLNVKDSIIIGNSKAGPTGLRANLVDGSGNRFFASYAAAGLKPYPSQPAPQ